uniref:mRNA interferase RelE/StbE n=1 Tax=Candidatus Kentrum sp. DK TaxID=2126562 RepID=A0A450T7Q6_9GAMM|nr:MAG: mRNA interferase RelE/StbE [Candidatus Kentron sp. DK]
MAFYKIEWKNSAVKELRRLPKRLVAKIISATEELTENPFPAGSRKIIGTKHTYRIRMGDYRIVFGVENDTIVILRVGHRRDIYRG